MVHDVIIIGAGPAGLTAGIYLARAGYKALILEKEAIGGQISSSPLVENYPGYVKISGSELSDQLYEQVTNLGVSIEPEEVKKIELGPIKKVITDYNTYEAKCIILSTGSKYKLLELDNEEKLIGKGIHFCVSCDGAFYKDKIVAVIGGGNSAVGNAIYLSELCKKVYLIYRGNKLKCEKKSEEKISKIDNVEIIYNTNVISINGTEKLESIVIKTNEEVKTLTIDGMFESIGMIAKTDLASSLLELDSQNYFVSDDCSTKIDGLFVAGDCRSKKVRQLTTAVSDGTISATLAIDYLNNL